jgi:hypothetical protein
MPFLFSIAGAAWQLLGQQQAVIEEVTMKQTHGPPTYRLKDA